MNPDLLRQLRELSRAPGDATRTPTPRAPRQMAPPVPVMRDRMANAMPVAPEPTAAQQLAQLVAEIAPGSGEGIAVRRATDDAMGGRYGEAAGELGLAALGVLPMGDALKGLLKGSDRVMDVWHGSRHKFPRFDIRHIGRGEGADKYGWGLYFAENPKVAETYRTAGRRFHDTSPGHLYRAQLEVSPDDLLDRNIPLGDQPRDLLTILREINPRVTAKMTGGEGYDLAANRAARMANKEEWGKEAIENVADELGIKLRTEYPGEVVQGDLDTWLQQFDEVEGQMSPRQKAIVRATIIEPRAAVSLALRDAGVPGLKYLDQESLFNQTPFTAYLNDANGRVIAASSVRTREAAERELERLLEDSKRLSPDRPVTTRIKERPVTPDTRNVVMFRDDRIRILEMLAAIGVVGAAEKLAQLKAQAQPTAPEGL